MLIPYETHTFDPEDIISKHQSFCFINKKDGTVERLYILQHTHYERGITFFIYISIRKNGVIDTFSWDENTKFCELIDADEFDVKPIEKESVNVTEVKFRIL